MECFNDPFTNMDPSTDNIAKELGKHKPSESVTSPSGSTSSNKRTTPSQNAPPRIRRRNRLITSCLECRRRKLKCDKLHPCTNCSKFARDCVFLAPALDPASQQKLTEIKEKMGSLERTLEEDVARKQRQQQFKDRQAVLLPGQGEGYSSDDHTAPEDEQDLEPTPLATEDVVYYDNADDELMDLGVQLGKMRITERIGGYVRPKMTEELAFAISEVPQIEDPLAAEFLQRVRRGDKSGVSYLGASTNFIAPASSLFFSSDLRKASILHYLPEKSAADSLVARYWVAVHPIVRVVHRPSFERQYDLLWKDFQSGDQPPNSFQALVLAVMLSAVLSLSDGDVLSQFGVPQSSLVASFMRGTEAALARANFLRTTKLETLQAFVAYLVPLCRSEVSRAHSALTGTAIRLAECMGLHRDGSHYGLTPVEVHVRRLIWHQLCFLDVRTCEATGPRPQIRKEDFDTQFPLNVDDVDLELPDPPTKDLDHFTDATIARMRFECNEMHRLIWVERPRIERKQTTLTAVLSKIQNFFHAMEKKYIPMLDRTNPLHQFGAMTYKILSYRMHVMILQRYTSNVRKLMPERLRQILITSGVGQVENAIRMETTPSFSPWAWYAGAFQQYHTALLLLSEEYATPEHYLDDRVWACLDYVFEMPDGMKNATKAKYILTELRDRTSVYQSYRKMRAPVGMMDDVKPRPVIRPLKPHPTLSPESSQHQSATPGVGPFLGVPGGIMSGGQELNFGGVVNGEALFAPAGMMSPPMLTSETSSSGGNPMDIPLNPSPGEMMLDIDWNEWDRLFPPNTNSNDVDVPDFGFPNPMQTFPSNDPTW